MQQYLQLVPGKARNQQVGSRHALFKKKNYFAATATHFLLGVGIPEGTRQVPNLSSRQPMPAGVDLASDRRAFDSLPSHSQTRLLWFVVFVVPFPSPWPCLAQQCGFTHCRRPRAFIRNGSVTRLGGQSMLGWTKTPHD